MRQWQRDADGIRHVTTQPQLPGIDLSPSAVVEWTFDPWRDRPVAASVAVLAVLLMWLLIASFRLPWVLALAQGVLVAAPLLPAFVPATCRVAPEGAARRGLFGWGHRSWLDVRRIDEVPIGVLLSPYAKRHWLDATRGLTLPMPRPRRAELSTFVLAAWRSHAA